MAKGPGDGPFVFILFYFSPASYCTVQVRIGAEGKEGEGGVGGKKEKRKRRRKKEKKEKYSLGI